MNEYFNWLSDGCIKSVFKRLCIFSINANVMKHAAGHYKLADFVDAPKMEVVQLEEPLLKQIKSIYDIRSCGTQFSVVIGLNCCQFAIRTSIGRQKKGSDGVCSISQNMKLFAAYRLNTTINEGQFENS